MNVETASIDDVHIDPANVRRHPERNRATIRASLTRFRAGRSIVLDANNVIRAGNGTIEEARQAGFDEVLIVEPKPNQIVAVKRADWTPSEATAYSVADNRASDLAEDDDAALASTLKALQSEDFDLAAVGYSGEELQGLIDGLATEALANGTPAEDPGPQVDRADELQKKWQTATGQLWVIPSMTTPGGEHRLLCGDSTKAEDVVRVMNGDRADICFTSPPYNLGTTSGGGFPKSGGMWKTSGLENGYATYGDDMPQDAYFQWQSDILRRIYDGVLSDHGAIYYNHRPRVQNGELLTPLRWNPGLPVRQIVIWNSGAGINFAPTHYRTAHEWIVIFAKPGFRLSSKGDSGCGDVWTESAAVREDGHPAPFPVELPRKAFETTNGTTAYDPYIGSGTTIVAAEQTGRLARGIEIAPRYVAVALERLEGMGLNPVLSDQTVSIPTPALSTVSTR